jgi:RecA-family ATPase
MPGPNSGPQASSLHWHSHNPPVRPKWLVKKLLPEEGVALMSGQWATGKTFMALHLAYCIAKAQPFAGQKIKRQGGTLLLAAEAAGDIPVRLQGITTHWLPKTRERLPFAWTGEVPKLSDRNACNQLVAMAGQVNATMQKDFALSLTLILVDTMSAAAGFNDENAAAEVQPVMNTLSRLAAVTNTLVMVVDHFGKAPNAGTRGSTAKESSADAVLTLTVPDTGHARVMSLRKLRAGPTGQHFAYSLLPVSLGVDEDGEEITTCVVQFNLNQQVNPILDPWKGCKDLKQSFDVAIRTVPSDIKLDPNGPSIKATPLEIVRTEFYATYPADGDQAQKQETRRKAWNRQLKRARDARLICTRDMNGKDFIWIAAAPRP